MLMRSGWSMAYSVTVLVFEEVGKSLLSVVGPVIPGELNAEFPFGELVGRHRYKLQGARLRRF